MIENIIIGLLLIAIQVGVIDKVIKNNNLRNIKRHWTPFRILFFQAICDHHFQLMSIYKEMIEEINSSLSKIRNKGYVETSEIGNIQDKLQEYQMRLSDSDKSFQNIIQTVSSNLQPEAAEHCNESLYFSFILNKYIHNLKADCNNVLQVDDLTDKNKTSHSLNGIDSDIKFIKIIVEARLKGFINRFSNSIWKTEGLYYHKGEIMEERDYITALETEKSIKELKEIPRTMPIKNFFETEEEFLKKMNYK